MTVSQTRQAGIALLAAGLALFLGSAHASGYGVQLSTAEGNLDGYVWGEDYWHGLRENRAVNYYQLGLMMDRGAPEAGYRFRYLAGLQSIANEIGSGPQQGVYGGLQIALISSLDRPVQFWLGPSISAAYLSGDAGSGTTGGVGAALGLDMRLGTQDLGIELEYQATRHSHFDKSSGPFDSDDMRLRVTYGF